ncbi:hypothetical protein ASG37_01780 [Sphingomonas sp. Leaf407]|uniref:class I SAM-dependent methyltransferase n=1 Tax=unclassified Sphingomonas TaxID=196159 RepID=UPI0006F40C2B|nr:MULTISPECIES: class I SAM-dependent methyltransferase [unclassified Sphingomonas]KQN40546.1 hypothetical protein ASE97_01805 [Sphingomonas sp. Leaf42]KQT29901.1 hypothetical protein ASG37_01780 [Sphingomonas sp. Leaf407]
MAKTNSSGKVGPIEKLRYAAALIRHRVSEASGEEAALHELRELQGYVASFEQATGKRAADSSVVEIGFGPRPRRAFLLSGMFAQVHAIDLDAPILSLGDALRTARTNGIERAVKSVARYALFDRREWPKFHATIRRELPGYAPDKVRFTIGSAGDEATWAAIGQADLMISFDVFEHIPPEELRLMLGTVRSHLRPGGMVISRPCVFTGITGGHTVEWYPQHAEQQPSGDTAWAHLTDPDFTVDTYLNRMSRADMRAMFEAQGFEVTRDHAELGRFCEVHLTPEKRALLKGYDDYELFSNNVEFHLKPRHDRVAA